MQDRFHLRRLTRSRRARVLAVATLVSGVLAAGCAESSGSPITSASTAPRGSATAGGSSTAAGGRAANSGSIASGPGGSGPIASGAAGSGPLAYAKCMRAHGEPNFPDPNRDGGFEFYAGQGIDPASPAFKAAQAKCRHLLPGGGPPGPGSTTHPSARTLAKLVRIAQCMRRHGIHQFPDPATSVPSNPAGYQEISDFDGAILAIPSTINLHAPAYKYALTACGAPPLGLPH